MNIMEKFADWLVSNKWRYFFANFIMNTVVAFCTCLMVAIIFAFIYKAIQ